MSGEFVVRIEDAAFTHAFRQLSENVQREAQIAALKSAALVLEREIKLELKKSGPSNSRMVTISRGPRAGQRTKRWLGPAPGGPGGPPGVFTGALRASVGMSSVNLTGGGYTVSVGPSVKYARALEMGSKPHPYMKPTWDASHGKVREAYLDKLKGFLP